MARRLQDKGAKLVLTDVDEGRLEEVAARLGGNRVLTAVADVRDLAAVQSAVDQGIEKFGGIDIVMANAGIASVGAVLGVDPVAFRTLVEVNALGARPFLIQPHQRRPRALCERQTVTRILTVLVVLVVLAGCTGREGEETGTSAPPPAAAAVTPEAARAIAKEAYIYGFPMVDSYRVQYAYFVNKQDPEYKGDWNEIHNTARVYTPEDKTIQTPNSDTP